MVNTIDTIPEEIPLLPPASTTNTEPQKIGVPESTIPLLESKKKPTQILKKYVQQIRTQTQGKIIGLLIIFFSAFSISAPFPNYIKKIGLMTLIIGLFWTLFLDEKNLFSIKDLTKNKKTKHLHIIFFTILIWILCSYIITDSNDIEFFFTISLIGILIIREFTFKYLADNIKKRLSYLTIGFFLFYLALLINKFLIMK